MIFYVFYSVVAISNLFIFLQFNLFNHIDTIDWIELVLGVSLFIVYTYLIALLCY